MENVKLYSTHHSPGMRLSERRHHSLSGFEVIIIRPGNTLHPKKTLTTALPPIFWKEASR